MIDSPNAECIGTCEIRFDMDQDAKLGSIILGGAIRDLLNRMDPKQAVEALGYRRPRTVIPGTELALRGQGAQRRLAA